MQQARDCYTWHLQQCIWLDYICNCFLIGMRPSDAHAGTRAFQTNGPYHPECTVANNGQQRPPFEHARRARIWPGNFNYSAHSLSALARSPYH